MKGTARRILNSRGHPIFKHVPEKLTPDSFILDRPQAPNPRLPKRLIKDAIPITIGQHIYMYCNIQTQQVVYSLTRHLNNHKSLEQIPFLGKKTVPAKLRKDKWLPLCLTTFPFPFAGLEAFRKLREYRRLHETQYDESIITIRSGTDRGKLMERKARGRVLMNQRANSIADLAAVLLQLDKGINEHRQEKSERRLSRKAQLERQNAPRRHKLNPVDLEQEIPDAEGVMVYWADPRDAEYAAEWPAVVQHDLLEQSHYTAAFPYAPKVEKNKYDFAAFGVPESTTETQGIATA